MEKRLQRLGLGLVVMGLVFFAAGGYTVYKTQQGASALQTFSAAQNVTLSLQRSGPARRPRRDRGRREDHVAPRERLGLRGRPGAR